MKRQASDSGTDCGGLGWRRATVGRLQVEVPMECQSVTCTQHSTHNCLECTHTDTEEDQWMCLLLRLCDGTTAERLKRLEGLL